MNIETKTKAPRKPRTKKVKAVALSPLGAFNQALAEMAEDTRKERAKLPEEPEMIHLALLKVVELETLERKIRVKLDELDALVCGVYARAEHDRGERGSGLQSVLWNACGADRTYAAADVLEATIQGVEAALEARAEELDPSYTPRVYRDI